MSLYLTIWLMLTVFTTIGRSATNEDYLKGIFFIDGSLQNNDHHIQIDITLCPHHDQSFDEHSDNVFLFGFECEWRFIVGAAVLFVVIALFMHQSGSSARTLSICVLTSLMQATHAVDVLEYILDEPLRINQAIKVTGDGFSDNGLSELYIIHIYPTFAFTALRDTNMLVSSDATDAIALDFKLTANKWEMYTFGKRIPEYDYNEIGWDANVTKVVVESIVNPVISIGEVTSIPSNVTPVFVATIITFILLSVAANAACIFLFYWKFKRPRKQTSEQEPTDHTKTETKELNTNEAEQTTIATEVDDPGTKDLKTKEANDDTEAPKLTEAGQTTIDTEVDDTETKDLKTEEAEEVKEAPEVSTERTKTTASDEPQEAKEPVWKRYLKIALPFTFLVEDYAALMLEDPDKTFGVDIGLVITLQFASILIIAWCSECCVLSVRATIIPKVLTITIEYLFAILLISYCTYVPLAGFIIGGLTILQVVSEIMSIIFDHETKETIWICPPFCKWCGLPDEPEDWEEERQLRKPELQSKFLVVMAMFMFMAIFFFLFGAIYVGSGCTHVSFAYLWTLGMFMFDRLWNTPALEIRSGENEWRKKLLIVQFAGFFLFMLVSTFLDPEAVGLDVQSQERMHTYDCTVSIGVLNLVRYYMIIIGLFLLFAYTNSCIFIFIQDIWFSILLRLFAYVSSLVFYCCGVQLECEHN